MWLKRLKISARNCRPRRSEMANFWRRRCRFRSSTGREACCGRRFRMFRERLNECGGIEVLIGAAVISCAGEIGIYGWAHGIACVAIVRWVVGQLRRERQAGLQRFDAADLPVAECAANPRAAVSEPRANGRSYVALITAGVTNVERCSAVVGLGIQRVGDERRRVCGDAGVELSPSSSALEKV